MLSGKNSNLIVVISKKDMPVSILFLSSCIFYSVLIGSLLYILTFQVSHQLKLRDGILKVQCSSCSVFSTSQQSFQEMLTSVKKIRMYHFVCI